MAAVVPMLLLAGVAFAALRGPSPKGRPPVAALGSPSPADFSTGLPVVPEASAVAAATPSAQASVTAGPTALNAPRVAAGATAGPAVSATPTPTSLPVTPAPTPQCVIQVTVTTDRSTYASGQAINITVTEHNAGNGPCDYTPPDQYGQVPYTVVLDSTGSNAWCSGGCNLPTTGGGGPPPQLAPGASASKTYTWNQQRDCANNPNCTQGQVDPGTYQAQSQWDSTTPASAPFGIS